VDKIIKYLRNSTASTGMAAIPLDRGRLARNPAVDAGGTPAVQGETFSFLFFVASW
jgi:hypothetical protein